MVLLASAYDQSRFFKAADLTQEKKLRIKDVTEEWIGTGADKEKKLVVWFTNDERGLVLNRVNNRTIRGAFGDPIEGWKGKIVILFPTMADFAARWDRPCGCASHRRSKPPETAKAKQQRNQLLLNHRRRRRQRRPLPTIWTTGCVLKETQRRAVQCELHGRRPFRS